MYPKILYCDVPPDAYHMKIFYSSLNFISHPDGIAHALYRLQLEQGGRAVRIVYVHLPYGYP